MGTHALKVKEEQKNAIRFLRAVLRIQFPSGDTLQACFAPLEPVSAVYDFVSGLLSEPHEPGTFDLYVAPPRTVLNPTDTIYSAHLVPGARIYASSVSLSPSALAMGPPPESYPSTSSTSGSSP